MDSPTTWPNPRVWSSREIQTPPLLHNISELAVVQSHLPSSVPVALPGTTEEPPALSSSAAAEPGRHEHRREDAIRPPIAEIVA